MSYKSSITSRSIRSRRRLLAEGVGSIDINQSMKIAREATAGGSIRSDWKAVGRDIRTAMNGVKRELETA